MIIPFCVGVISDELGFSFEGETVRAPIQQNHANDNDVGKQ